MGRYADAVGLLLRFALACHGVGLGVSQAKCYLGAVVVWLFAQDAAQAWAVYQARIHAQEFCHNRSEAIEASFSAVWMRGDAADIHIHTW